jgi:hypothetical protein
MDKGWYRVVRSHSAQVFNKNHWEVSNTKKAGWVPSNKQALQDCPYAQEKKRKTASQNNENENMNETHAQSENERTGEKKSCRG